MFASLIVVITGVSSAPNANAALATCSAGSAAQNSIAVEPSHPTVMYIDSGISPRVDAAYIGYLISNRTGATLKGYWASLDNFTGGSISLANPLDKYVEVPEIANNETKTVYVLVKASSATTVKQAHDFKIYNEFPTSASAVNKYACNFGFTKVAETIQASANKPIATTIVGGTVPTTIGTTFQIKSTGESGVIGAGSADVGKIMWFTPAAYSTFPTRAFRLESVQIRIGSKSGLSLSGGNVWIYNERTYVTPTTTPSIDASFTGEETTADSSFGNKRFYENYYTFRIIDAASASVAPMAQISSGKQIKHSSTGAGSSVSVNASAATIPASISKALVSIDYASFPKVTIGGNSYTEVPYKITLSTTSATSIKADKIVDVPASNGIFKSGSVEVSTNSGSTFSAYADAETLTSESALSPRPLNFFGPFVFTSSASLVLKYKIYIPSIAGTYSNSATGFIGDRRIVSSTTASIPRVNVVVNETGTVTTSETTTVKLVPDPQTKLASNVDTSTATINGTLLANDTTTAGYFEWGTSPTLSAKTTISLGNYSGSSLNTEARNLTGLTPETTYYFRIIGIASGIRYEGAILSFTTLAQKDTPTIVTESPANVSLTNATLRATVDPNLTPVYVEFQVWYTGVETRTVRMVDDPTIVFNNNDAQDTYNPYTSFSGSTSQLVSINMGDVAYGLSGWISSGRTIYYRARIVEVTGSAATNATAVKQFKFASYSDQTITFSAISDITWGDAAPVISPTATSTMTVTRSSLTPTVCSIDGSGNIVILSIGTCSVAANQPGGEREAGVFFNPAPEVIQSFEILAKAITITAEAKSKNYSESDPSLTYSITGSVNAGDVTGSLTRTSGENVGTYSISQGSVEATSNYSVTYVSANLTINALAITITAAAKTKVYGELDPGLTYTISPSLKVGDSVSGALSRNAGESVGTHTIIQNTLSVSSNYTVTYTSANLTITAKPLTIKAENKTKASGGSTPTFTYTLSGLVSPDSVTSVSLTFPDGSGGQTATVPTLDGNYVITPSAAVFGTGSSSNYVIAYETGTYTITSKLPQVLTWTSISTKTYGDTATATVTSDRSLTVTVTSSSPSICTVPNSSVSGATVTILAAGTCQLNASQAGDATYAAATDATTSFVVNPKALTITATISASPKNYGDASATAGFTNSTLVGSDAISGVTNTFTSGAPSYNSTSVPTLAGTYTLTPSTPVFSTGSSSNYTITYVTVSYLINKKALTITASSHSVTEGDAIPSITASYSTFAYSETAADLTGSQTCSTVYTTTSAAGSYSSSCSGYASDNYIITYVSGSITVAAAGGGTTYTITYSLNGGSGTTPTETEKSNGQTFTTPTDSGFSRGGYSFGGWSCNSVTTAVNTVVTVGTSNITCTAIWNKNAGSSNSNSNNSATVTPAAIKKIAIASLVTIAVTPVKSTITVMPATSTPSASPSATPKPSATPSPSASPKPSATPSPSASPKPSASPSASSSATPKPNESSSATPQPSPTKTPTKGISENSEGITLSKTTVIPTADTKSLAFKGIGISKVAVVNDEVSVAAKPGFSGKTVVTITLKDDKEISVITANVLVFPLPATNVVVRQVNEEKTQITWKRSPNAIGYEVIQNEEVLCTTKAASCTLNRKILANPPVEIKSLGKDETENVIKEATYIAAPVRVIPEVELVINFDTNKFNLDTGDRILIQNFAMDVQIFGYKEVDITGHTDSRGGVDNNVLSNNRAKAASAYLLQLIPTLKVTVNGYADAISVAPNTTVAGLAANRRAEFRVVK
jgi:uncharacterized repeat protein (TIGR02543 family)